MFAVKANRQQKISAEEKQRFIDLGYRIAELKKGKLVFEEVETVETKEIARLEAENKALQEAMEKLEAELKQAKGEGK